MVETARDGPRPSHSLSLSLFFPLLLRFAQSVAKQLVCFVRGLSDRLRADNRQTIRRGCFASRDSRHAISPAISPCTTSPASLGLQTGSINSGAIYIIYIISICSSITRYSQLHIIIRRQIIMYEYRSQSSFAKIKETKHVVRISENVIKLNKILSRRNVYFVNV